MIRYIRYATESMICQAVSIQYQNVTDGRTDRQTSDRIDIVWMYQIVKKFENMFTRIDTIHERDRRTDTARRHRARYDSVARQKR